VEIRQLEYFCTVMRLGSLTRAAEELLISQPALTRQIRRLERELGVPLFQRVPSGMRPTPSAVALHRHGLTILELVRTAAEAATLAQPVLETVDVGLPPGVPEDWVFSLLATVRAEVPLARLNFTDADSTTQLRMLREGHLDIALIHQPAPVGLTAIMVRQDRFGVACRPGTPAADSTGPWAMRRLDGIRVLVHAREQFPVGYDRLVAATHSSGVTPLWQFASYIQHAAACAEAAAVDISVKIEPSAARQLPDWSWQPLSDPVVMLDTWAVHQPNNRSIVTAVIDVFAELRIEDTVDAE
jgi:DNA-binding transcriptional LysR family regulator